MPSRILGILVAWLAFPAIALAGESLQGTADFETFSGDTVVSRGKLYVSGNRLRLETDSHGAKIAILVDTRAMRMWTLMPPPIGCRSQPLTESVKQGSPWLAWSGAKEEFVGSETIDGHPTKKYKATTRINESPHVQYVWRATDLKSFPVQIADDAGRFRRTLKNVVLGKPSAALFRPLATCRSKSIPGDASPQNSK